MKVRFRTVDSVLDEIEAMQHRVAERAQKIFRERGGALGGGGADYRRDTACPRDGDVSSPGSDNR